MFSKSQAGQNARKEGNNSKFLESAIPHANAIIERTGRKIFTGLVHLAKTDVLGSVELGTKVGIYKISGKYDFQRMMDLMFSSNISE